MQRSPSSHPHGHASSKMPTRSRWSHPELPGPHSGLKAPPEKPCPTHLAQPALPLESTRHTLALQVPLSFLPYLHTLPSKSGVAITPLKPFSSQHPQRSCGHQHPASCSSPFHLHSWCFPHRNTIGQSSASPYSPS